MKNVWKRIVAAVMLLAVMASLAACGESGKSDKSASRRRKKEVVGTWMYTDEDGDRRGYKLEELDLADKETGERYGWAYLKGEGYVSGLVSFYYHFISDTEIEIVKSVYSTSDSGRTRYAVLTIGKENGETVLIDSEDGIVYYKEAE